MKLGINGKMLTYVLSASLVIYIGAISYISYRLKSVSSEKAEQLITSQVVNYTNQISGVLGVYFNSSKILAATVAGTMVLEEDHRRDAIAELLRSLMEQDDAISGIYAKFDASAIDNRDSLFAYTHYGDTNGSFLCRYERMEDIGVVIDSTPVYDIPVYLFCKGYKDLTVLNPVLGEDGNYRTEAMFPVFIDGEVVGAVSIIFNVNVVQEYLDQLQVEEGSFSTICFTQGFIWAGEHEDYYGLMVDTFGDKVMEEVAIDTLETLQTFWDFNKYKQEYSLFFTKKLFRGSEFSNWKILVSYPEKAVYKTAQRTLVLTIIIGIIGLVIMSIFIFFVSKIITVPMVNTTKKLQAMAMGDLDVADRKKSKFLEDEMTEILDSMQDLAGSLRSASEFSHEIGKGNLESEYNLISHEDVLGRSLLSMQNSLKKAREEEARKKIEDEKRNWVTQGLARFGEIVREDNDNMEKFCNNVLQNLLKYINVAQGAIYVRSESDHLTDEFDSNGDEFKLLAVQAYGKVVMKNDVAFEGKELVGRAIDENKIILLQDLPENYAELSPGMKDQSRPNNLLIAPMSINEDPYGVLELLSFDRFEEHHVDFIEKLSENIASVISSVNINIKTASLLEQSQIQADELAQHEEEMRQNLEEMQATQEESQKREEDLLAHITSLYHNLICAQIGLNGRVLEVSPLLAAKYNVSIDAIVGKHFDSIVTQDEKARGRFLEFWDRVMSEGRGEYINTIEVRGKKLTFRESYVKIERENTSPKILMVAEEKTKGEELKDKFAREVEALKEKGED